MWNTILLAVKREWTTVIFSIMFVIAWIINALKLASFDLSQLTMFYTTVRGAFLVGYITDSTANSKKGENPYKQDREYEKGEA